MQIIDNFESSFKKFLDARQSWESYSELTSNENILMPNGFKAYCREEDKWYKLSTEDEDDPTTYVWTEEKSADEAIAIASAALLEAKSSKANLEEDITANVEVGGLNVGDTIYQGDSITDVLKQILVKYFPPEIVYTTSELLVQKKGTTVDSVDLDVTITKTVKDLISYTLSLNDNTLASGSNASGGELIYTYSTPFSTNTTFVVEADDGKDGATKDIKFEFVNPYYYGKISENDLDDFTGLTEEVVKKNVSKKVAYTATAEYIVFAYDSSYGNLTSIKDKNNFENLPAFVKSTKTIGGEVYNVYISADKITCNNFEYTFKI